MTDLKRLAELAGLNELQVNSPFIDLDQAVNAALSYYNSGQSDGSIETAVKYAAQEYKADYEALLAQTKFYLKHPEALKNEDVGEGIAAHHFAGLSKDNPYPYQGKQDKTTLYTGSDKDRAKLETMLRDPNISKEAKREIAKKLKNKDVEEAHNTHGFIAGERVRHLEQQRIGTVRGYENGETAVEFDDEPGEIYYVDNQSLELSETMNEPSDAEMFGATELTEPIEGMEGPWRMKNGRTVYYDPREGKYYDRGMDMYLSQDEANDLHFGNMREEYDAFKEADPFGGAMFSPPGGELDDSVLDNAISNAQYDAQQFDVSPYSSHPEDYEGQLQAITDEIISDNSGQEVQEIDDWYQIMTQALEPIIGPKLKAHMGMTEENLNELEKAPKFAWFEPSKGPENYPGFELRYLKPNPNYDPASTPSMMKDGPFYTPSFGWWKSVEDYQAGGESFSGETKDKIEAEHNMQWLPDRPSREEGMKLLQVTNEDSELSRLQQLAGIEEDGVGVLTAQNTTADVKKGTLRNQGSKFGFDITDMGIPPRVSKDSSNK